MDHKIEIDADLLKDLEDSDEEKIEVGNNQVNIAEAQSELRKIFGEEKEDFIDKEVRNMLF